MKILAIDTAAETASAAVTDGGRVLGEYALSHKKTHSQKLMVLIERMMSDLELDMRDIDLFAAAQGPGSFTGLRIGIATIKALAHSVNKPVAGVSTLESLAYNLPFADGIILPVMDARNRHVFNAAYKWTGSGLKTVIQPNVCGIDECAERIKGENVIFVGDGVNVHEDLILSRGFKTAPVNARLNRASSAAAAALVKAGRGETLRYTELTPVYLRLSQAEQELEKRMAREAAEAKGELK